MQKCGELNLRLGNMKNEEKAKLTDLPIPKAAPWAEQLLLATKLPTKLRCNLKYGKPI